jgi:hypothetical protein
MLFSSGGSPQFTSSILSGEGFDEVQPGESPFVVSAGLPYLPIYLAQAFLKQRRLHSTE